MSTSLAIQALKHAVREEKTQESLKINTTSVSSEAEDSETSSPPTNCLPGDNLIAVEEIINGVRTCLPLLNAALSSDSDDPFKVMDEMIESVKILTKELVPQVFVPGDALFAQKVYSLRSLLISVVARAYEESRATAENPKELRSLIQQVVKESEIFAEYSDAEYNVLDEHFFRMTLAVAASLKMIEMGFNKNQIASAARSIYSVTVKAFSLAYFDDRETLTTILNACRRPVIELVEGVFDAERRKTTAAKISGIEVSQDEVVQNVIRQYEFMITELVTIVHEGAQK